MRVAGSIFFIWMSTETTEGMNRITSTAAILNLLNFFGKFLQNTDNLYLCGIKDNLTGNRRTQIRSHLSYLNILCFIIY